jgi:hypothetical protein
MATANEIVQLSLKYLGVQNQLTPADPRVVDDTFNELVDMLNRWASVGIDLGITIPTDISDELGNPAETKTALASALALEALPVAKVDVTPRLLAKYKRAYRSLKAAYGKHPQQLLPSSLPMGAGVNLGPRSRRFFPEPAVVGTDDNNALGT